MYFTKNKLTYKNRFNIICDVKIKNKFLIKTIKKQKTLKKT